MMNKKLLLFIFFILIVFDFPANAGGVSLGATRVIYKSEDNIKQLSIYNSDENSEYLLQSWVEDDKGRLSKDFVVIPPLVLIKADSENSIRLIKGESELPNDRETVYWLNVKSIPEKSKSTDTNSLQFAITSRIKIFFRPESLSGRAGEAYKNVSFFYKEGQINASNPTPYYVTLTNVRFDNKDVESVMLSPKSTHIFEGKGMHKLVQADSINDYGGLEHITASIVNIN